MACLLLLVAGVQSAWAQKVVLNFPNGESVKYRVSELDSITFEEKTGNDPIVIEEHECVDLGLPSGTLWATCNVGADCPEGYGDYFAWGETQPKQEYSWGTYQLCYNGPENQLTKYCTKAYYGYEQFVDNKTELEAEDDAATANWGSKWQMPLKEQFRELREYTTGKRMKQNEVSGTLLTSKVNGKSIFLPLAGYIDTTGRRSVGSYGDYWSRSLSNSTILAYECHFISGPNVGVDYRYQGCSVRPVCVQERPYPWLVTSIELDQTQLEIGKGTSGEIKCSAKPSYAKNSSVVWESSDETVATVNVKYNNSTSYCTITAVGAGTCTVTCSSTDGSDLTAECQVTVYDHWYVDLELPSGTLWATCNVGASAPEEYGSYFAWGETEPKEDYSWGTYKFCEGTENTMTKYNETDGLTELEPEDDAAVFNWDMDWQMPNANQLRELVDGLYTTTEWTTQNGVEGLEIKSRRNNKSIFLPGAGFCQDVNSASQEPECGFYWSCSFPTESANNAFSLYVDTVNNCVIEGRHRRYGATVRPVRVQDTLYEWLVTNIRLDATEFSLLCGGQRQLTATILPEYAKDKSYTWESSDESIATIDETGKVTAVSLGSCTITCKASDGSGVEAECKVYVIDHGKTDGHEWVDLGLPSGTLWATCNIGADSPEAYGNYYPWGETEPKDNYSWSTYKYAAGTSSTLTKYCTDSNLGNEGFTDGLTELLPEDDVATVKWGSNWQMPSKEQFEELINSEYTTTEVVKREDGIRGRKITSLINGQSIFFPFSGGRMSTYDPLTVNTYGYYWTRIVSTEHKELNDNGYGYCLWMTRNDIYMGVFERKDGATVRPVRKR